MAKKEGALELEGTVVEAEDIRSRSEPGRCVPDMGQMLGEERVGATDD